MNENREEKISLEVGLFLDLLRYLKKIQASNYQNVGAKLEKIKMFLYTEPTVDIISFIVKCLRNQ